MSVKQLRYTITRVCLNTGSLAVLKYLEPYLPKEGALTVLLEGGREIRLEARGGRLYDLSDFFAQHKLAVNDALLFTPLEASRWQLEIQQKTRVAPVAATILAVPAPMESIIEDESSHVRVVRKQPAVVSPYPNGILYPSSEKTDAPAIEPEKPMVLSTVIANISTPKPEVVSPLEALTRTFTHFGYTVTPLENGLQLEARLPRGTHRIALALDGHGENNDVLKAGRLQGAKYLAIATTSERIGLIDTTTAFGNVARVELEALSTLEKLQEHFALTPLELEGYWNAGGIRQDALESIQQSINQRLETRGEFSFIMLALRHFNAPCAITPEDIVAKLPGSGIGTSTVLQVLETLSKAPFMLITPLGMGEYHLKTSLDRGLEDIAGYVSSVKMRLRTSAPQKADSTLTRVR